MRFLANKQRWFPAILAVCIGYACVGLPDVQAGERLNDNTKTVLKQSAIGAGIGAITGGVSERGTVLKGAGVGALTGAGTGLIDTSRTMERHPLLKNTAKGAVIGTGVSATTDRSKVKGAAVGAGAGAGWHLLKDYLDKKSDQ